MLLKQGNVVLKMFAVNPDTSLFPTPTDNVSEYDCLQTVEEAYSSRPDVWNVPPEDLDWELCADESSFMQDGEQVTSYAVTTTNWVTGEEALPSAVSSWGAELITSVKNLELSEVIWKERRLAAMQGTGIEHTEQIHARLQSIWESREAAFMHCKVHQNRETSPKLKNHFADKIVKAVAEKGILTVVPQREIDLLMFSPKCYQKDHQFSGTKAEIKRKQMDCYTRGTDRSPTSVRT